MFTTIAAEGNMGLPVGKQRNLSYQSMLHLHFIGDLTSAMSIASSPKLCLTTQVLSRLRWINSTVPTQLPCVTMVLFSARPSI